MKKHSGGFTLIELVMVMVLIGILALVAFPRFENINRTRAQAAAMKLRSDLRYIQMLSMQTQQQTRVVFNAAADNYQLQILNLAGWAAVTNPGTRAAYSVQLNAGEFQGVDISAADFNGGSTVIFNRLGVPADAAGTALVANGVVTLNGAFQVTVSPSEGVVEMVTL